MGLFGWRHSTRAAPDIVYAFTFKVTGGRTKIPDPMIGAYVIAYSSGTTPADAAERSVNKLRAMGYVVEDMETNGGQIAIARWDEHVAERWPEFISHFPNQQHLIRELEQTGAVLSPFAGFEAQHERADL